MKKLALVWVILATIVAAVTTILNLEPAATFIDLSASSDGSFFIAVPVGLTFIVCILPLFPIMIINNIIQNKKNKMPSDLTGRTGVVVQRAKELPNAALMFNVLINNEQKARVGMGKKIFIELPEGDHQIQIKLSKRIYSATLPIKIETGKIIGFHTKVDLNKSLTSLVPSGEMLLLTQIPFSAIS
jgi:hypothetical protein